MVFNELKFSLLCNFTDNRFLSLEGDKTVELFQEEKKELLTSLSKCLQFDVRQIHRRFLQVSSPTVEANSLISAPVRRSLMYMKPNVANSSAGSVH